MSPVLEPFHCGNCQSLLAFRPVQAQMGIYVPKEHMLWNTIVPLAMD